MSVLLFLTWNCHETRSMFFIASIPNDHDLLYGNETHFVVAVLQVKYAFFYLHHFAAKARGAATKNIYSLADHFGQQFLHSCDSRFRTSFSLLFDSAQPKGWTLNNAAIGFPCRC